MYTNSPDLHFIVDQHPESERVWVVSACSGHGFKFAPVLGDVLSETIATGSSDLDLSPFALGRFGRAVTPMEPSLE